MSVLAQSTARFRRLTWADAARPANAAEAGDPAALV